MRNIIKFTDKNNRLVAILGDDDQEPKFLDQKEQEKEKEEEDENATE